MFVKKGDFQCNITGFNFTVRKRDGRLNSSLSLSCDQDGDMDAGMIAEAVNNDAGTIEIHNEDRSYVFDGFGLEEVTRFVSGEDDKVIITLVK